MPNVYGLIIWGSCIGSIVLPLVVFAFIIRQYPKGRLARFADVIWLVLLIAFCCISSGMFDLLVAEEIQARVAVPYIQKALNNQCPNTNTKVSAKGFIMGSIISWESETTNEHCAYIGAWECECNFE